MSKSFINDYLNNLSRIKKFSGSLNENVIREAFKDLLKAWSRQKKLHFISEYEFQSSQKTRIRPDGTILHESRIPLGHWEAKDTNDNLESEIQKKLSKGYPQDNIIFEDSQKAILIQNRVEVIRCNINDTEELSKLLDLFFDYEPQAIHDFRKAIEQFKKDLPYILEALREKINIAYDTNISFKNSANVFLEHARSTIAPEMTKEHIHEMLIQHILTEDIFSSIFKDADFHRQNNIAEKLYALESEFFTGSTKRETLKNLEPYYIIMRSTAEQISNHSEKQKFLKVIYEKFYKVYNPKGAEKLGVIYTPNEIVKFIIEGVDWLCEKHFKKNLIDKNVEILDPATGTGTFICELLDYFRGQPEKLAHKYNNELYANEIDILPYYIANLNIETTYFEILGQFKSFPNLSFVDTLDNIQSLVGEKKQPVADLFGTVSKENSDRIKRQNDAKISVIIGNPPYRANQKNANDFNKNRKYKEIDIRIKNTYTTNSNAQKNKNDDPYLRFFRWATDRMVDNGIIGFITNRSFIDATGTDGFRKTVAKEFNEIYIIDLGGDIRDNPKLSGTKNNVFGIQTGVAISFFVKKNKQNGCKIFYARRPEFDDAQDKLSFISANRASSIQYKFIEPDKDGRWIDIPENCWEKFIPVITQETKKARNNNQDNAIFKLFSNGIVTAKDPWVYDFSHEHLKIKMQYFIKKFNEQRNSFIFTTLNKDIKWSESLEKKIKSIKNDVIFNDNLTKESLYRPFFKYKYYSDKIFSDRLTSLHYKIFGSNLDLDNEIICFSGTSSSKPFQVLASRYVPSLDLLEKTQILPRYRYSDTGEKIDNITDWGLKKFIDYYGIKYNITKDDIFHYIYAILHNPLYREKYKINLKQEFPHIPLYPNFEKWVQWGKELMNLHIHYETIEAFPFKRIDKTSNGFSEVKLKSDMNNGQIIIDDITTLSEIPPKAFQYKLGNRSAIDWILDQYGEKKFEKQYSIIQEKFNNYRFIDYKEDVINLLGRVINVAIKTEDIIEQMKKINISV